MRPAFFLDADAVSEIKPLFLIKKGNKAFFVDAETFDQYASGEMTGDYLGLYAHIVLRGDEVIKNDFW